jgi:hypothetical protein
MLYPIEWANMAYELFDSKSPMLDSPQFTVRAGKIAFNADSGEILSKAGAKFAHLLWDAEACRLGVRPTERRDGRAFKVSFFHGKRGGTISAQSFLKYIQWHAEGPVVVSASWSDPEHMLEASLPREHVGKSQMGRRSARHEQKE